METHLILEHPRKPASIEGRFDTLDAIRAPVRAELREFAKYFRSAMQTDVRLLDRVIRYMLRVKGKRIRPVLVLLAARTCGEITETSYRGAALVELLHTATLVHDDVVDDADQRRGMFSINALWKNKVAVLFGDYLLSRGLLLALDYRDYDLLHVLSSAVKRMSEGELLQIEKSRRLDIDEPTYFRIIGDKTASLLSACTTAGAISATNDPDVIGRMRQIGEDIGVAYQIRDDLFDYGDRDVGKPLGIDLRERKLTLPLIHTLREADAAERKQIMRIVRRKRKSREDTRTIATMVEASGGIEYTRTKMKEHADRARTGLAGFDASDARDALLGLVDYIVVRSS